MKTLQKQTSPSGEEKSMFSQVGFHANLSVSQEADLERTMTATSGRKCFGRYGRYSQLGLLVKMLMVSSQWYSPAMRLKWDARTVSLKKVILRERSRNLQSAECVRTLSERDIQSNRLLFQLVPSERHTDETGCGLWRELLKTPSTMDASDGLSKAKPNPKSGDSGCLAQEIVNGYAFTRGVLPTPQTHGLKVCNKDGKTEFLNLELLPTPKSQEARGNCSVNRKKSNLTDKIAEIMSPTGATSQLNPLFVAEMMGYPLDWLTLPFLSQSGEAKASRR